MASDAEKLERIRKILEQREVSRGQENVDGLLDTIGQIEMELEVSQCKEPLFESEPNIHICIKETKHDGLHHTYTANNDDIYYTARRHS